ncbi:MAG: NYN domain-containing protein [Kineosporiaceae bacterium]
MLPPAVRRAVLAVAAACLEGLEPAEVPPPLRRVRAFAPARRAAAGAGPLSQALDADPVFRQRVAARWRASQPALAQVLDQGGLDTAEPLAGGGPQDVAVGLFLIRPPGWPTLLGEVVAALASTSAAGSQGPSASPDAEVEAVERRLADVQSQLQGCRQELDAARTERDAARKAARRDRADADRARAAARAAAAELAALREELAEARRELEIVGRERDEARAQAQEGVAAQRRASGRRAELDEVRARLLLDTLVDAASGLRRELALPPATARPADLALELGLPAEPAGAVGAPSVPDGPASLRAWLALPQAHLVVDGYNVTKTAHPSRTLVEQRRWLVDALGGVVARTGAEVTCCFDGAAAVAEPGVLTRRVRVLFSGAGTEADDLIRGLVRAEPRGRVVVVVSSDAAVARSVTAMGGRAVASVDLLRYLGHPPAAARDA